MDGILLVERRYKWDFGRGDGREGSLLASQGQRWSCISVTTLPGGRAAAPRDQAGSSVGTSCHEAELHPYVGSVPLPINGDGTRPSSRRRRWHQGTRASLPTVDAPTSAMRIVPKAGVQPGLC
jgi:hypothetical protein